MLSWRTAASVRCPRPNFGTGSPGAGMTLEFHPAVQRDFNEALDYYEAEAAFIWRTARKRNIHRIAWPARFTRELVVVVRRNREIPEHISQSIANVLF